MQNVSSLIAIATIAVAITGLLALPVLNIQANAEKEYETKYFCHSYTNDAGQLSDACYDKQSDCKSREKQHDDATKCRR